MATSSIRQGAFPVATFTLATSRKTIWHALEHKICRRRVPFSLIDFVIKTNRSVADLDRLQGRNGGAAAAGGKQFAFQKLMQLRSLAGAGGRQGSTIWHRCCSPAIRPSPGASNARVDETEPERAVNLPLSENSRSDQFQLTRGKVAEQRIPSVDADGSLWRAGDGFAGAIQQNDVAQPKRGCRLSPSSSIMASASSTR